MSKLKNCLFGTCGFDSTCAQVIYMLFRGFIGYGLFTHGKGKLPPSEEFVGMLGGKLGMAAPEAMAWMAGIGEGVCGVLIMIGLFTRPSAIWAGITLLVAAYAHVFGSLGGGFEVGEKALLYVFAIVLICALGGGKFSIDSAIFRKK